MKFNSLLDAIGHTPLVRLRGPRPDVEVYAKLELNNPYGMKDRVARHIITEALRRGDLAPGAPLVESSSGTMALGVALVGTLLGHPVYIVTDPRIDRITLAKLHAVGCVVDVVPKMDAHGWQGARLARLAELMAELPGSFWPRQYDNPDNPAAYGALAAELLADLDPFDVLVGAVGSGGSLCGSARALRRRLPGLRAVGVDAVGSVLFGQPDRPGRLQSGLGNSLHPPNLDHSIIDEVHWLNDREAFAAARDLAREQKLFCGNTSGSVYRVLCALAERARPGTRLVGILPDRGDRYVDSVYDDGFWAERGLDTAAVAATPQRVRREDTVNTWSYARLNRDGDGRATPSRGGRRTPRRAVVFVESNTTGSGMAALRTARHLGLVPLFLTADPSRYPDLGATGATVVDHDTNDLDALRRWLARPPAGLEIVGITTTSEFYLHTVARLASELDLPADDPDAVATCRDKGALRAALAHAGVLQPTFAVAGDLTAVPAALAVTGVPCVVKPVDESGSTGVRLCRRPGEAARHIGEVLARQRNGRGQPVIRRVLVEEYLPDPEFSVEMFAADGEHRLLGIVEKWVIGEPHFVEHRHVLPAALPPSTAAELVDTVRRALVAVGLRLGATHTEVKLSRDGPVIIEINPRLAGGMIPELFRLTTGADLVRHQIGAAVGLPFEAPGSVRGHAGIEFLLAANLGTLVRDGGVDAARAVDGVRRVTVTARPGQRVGPAVDAYGRLGHIIATGESRSATIEALRRASELVDLEVRADLVATS